MGTISVEGRSDAGGVNMADSFANGCAAKPSPLADLAKEIRATVDSRSEQRALRRQNLEALGNLAADFAQMSLDGPPGSAEKAAAMGRISGAFAMQVLEQFTGAEHRGALGSFPLTVGTSSVCRQLREENLSLREELRRATERAVALALKEKEIAELTAELGRKNALISSLSQTLRWATAGDDGSAKLAG